MTTTYKPLFIVGYPRSGTTWTMWLLAQHPEIVTTFHGGFFHSLAPIEKWRKTSGSFGKFIVPGSPDGLEKAGNQKDHRVEIQAALPPDIFNEQLAEMARGYFDFIAANGRTPRVVVENTPENLEFLNWILDIMPEAYVLHIIRDPRSIWVSVRHSLQTWMEPHGRGSFPKSLSKNINRWSNYMQIGREIQKRTNHYCELRYETLQYNGVEELERIFNWLELPVDRDFCEQAFANTTLDKLRQKMPAPNGFINKGLTEGWKEALSSSEIRQIEYLAGDWMDTLQYERQWPRQTRQPWQLWVGKQKARVSRYVKRKINQW